jgi:hypothetical protein
MAIRRLNYTGRKRIKRTHAQIGIIRGDTTDASRFLAQLNLGEYLFPPDAKIFVEAYRQTRRIRFEYGTVAFPREVDTPVLTDFDVVEAIRFRVKVLAADGSGKLLGEADQIAPVDMEEAESKREGLLPVKPEDLGHQLWWVDFDSGGPILLVSKRSGDWKGFTRSPHFQWLVLPAVLRLILEKLVELGSDADDDSETWEGRWMGFASTLRGAPSSISSSAAEEDKQQWIQDTCAAFARQSKYVGKFSETLFGGDSE